MFINAKIENMVSFAIIDSNILTGLGLQEILEDIIPVADITVMQTFEELQRCDAEHFVHFFVSSSIYFEHTQYFRQQAARSIVLVHGDMHISGVKTINVCQSEKNLVRDILAFSRGGRGGQNPHGNVPVAKQAMEKPKGEPQILSARELEVAMLLSRGFINKEVADKLDISLTTVITHRKNIMDKLHARSLADIIVYVVMNGFVDVSEL